MQNIGQTIASQFADSNVLDTLIERFDAAIDPNPLITAFYNDMFNPATAIGYGLDVIGRIVGVSRVLTVSVGSYFGFIGPSGQSGIGWNQAPFYNGQPTTSNYNLTDDAFRTLIYAKMLANISNNSIPSINNILMTLFGASGVCYCTDGLNMTMTYTFTFVPSAVQLSIIETSGVLPRPSGVSVSVVT